MAMGFDMGAIKKMQEGSDRLLRYMKSIDDELRNIREAHNTNAKLISEAFNKNMQEMFAALEEVKAEVKKCQKK